MSGPTFAVARTLQQTIDQSLMGVGPGILDEGVDVGRLGRESPEVEEHPPDEHGPIGLRRWADSARLQRRQDETVDLVAGPSPVPDLGNGDRGQRLEGPPGAVLVGDRSARSLGKPGAGLGPRCPLPDPVLQQGRLLAAQRLPLRGHPMLRLPRADPIHQRTGFGMPHHDRRLSRFSTLQHARTRIQDEPPADAVGRMAVALEALPLEQRANLGLQRCWPGCGPCQCESTVDPQSQR